MRRLCILILLGMACAAQAEPQSNNSELSTASQMAEEGSGFVVWGSLTLLAASGNVVVKSVEAAGDGSVIVLAGASDAGQAAVRLSGEAARGLSAGVGASVAVTEMASGYLLVAAGKVIAFVPNEAGKALLHHARLSAERS